MSVPPRLQLALQEVLGTALHSIHMVGGGDINQAARVSTMQERFFLKWHPQSPQGMFTAEARSLQRLAETSTVRVPAVIAWAEATADTPAYLLLEWLVLERPHATEDYAEKLGEALAALHRVTADTFGLEFDNFIGRLPQPNTAETSWAIFYGEHRIRAQMALARMLGNLPSYRERLLNSLIEKLPALLPADEIPALLHGDLWGGNAGALQGGVPVLYDPAVYYGSREVDLAMTRLFGGFSPRFYEAYQAVFPLPAAAESRIALYQLYPVMVHMNLFGGHYAAQVDALARQYVNASHI